MSKKNNQEKTNNYVDEEQRKPAIVFLSISLALFLAFIGFFVWHTVRMRDYELNYVKTQGTVVDVRVSHSSSSHGGSKTSYYFVISYTFEDRDYTFTDRTGHEYSTAYGNIGKTTVIYVHPQNPEQAESVSSAPFVSIICACFFAFFCATYAAGMNILLSVRGSSFEKRFVFAWGVEILLGIAFILLFWLGLPHSSFSEVFARINGAIGITVVSCLVLLIASLDGTISYILRSKHRYRRKY